MGAGPVELSASLEHRHHAHTSETHHAVTIGVSSDPDPATSSFPPRATAAPSHRPHRRTARRSLLPVIPAALFLFWFTILLAVVFNDKPVAFAWAVSNALVLSVAGSAAALSRAHAWRRGWGAAAAALLVGNGLLGQYAASIQVKVPMTGCVWVQPNSHPTSTLPCAPSLLLRPPALQLRAWSRTNNVSVSALFQSSTHHPRNSVPSAPRSKTRICRFRFLGDALTFPPDRLFYRLLDPKQDVLNAMVLVVPLPCVLFAAHHLLSFRAAFRTPDNAQPLRFLLPRAAFALSVADARTGGGGGRIPHGLGSRARGPI